VDDAGAPDDIFFRARPEAEPYPIMKAGG